MIWYACYGSNMDWDRFLDCLQVGNLNVAGTDKQYMACEKDTAVPRETEPYFIDGELYFAWESKTWKGHGVAFLRENGTSRVYSRLYLISKEQFEHLFAAENGRITVKVDYHTILEHKFQDFDYTFYNRIVLLDGNYKGFPVMTFTNGQDLQKNEPFDEYLQLIAKGLKEVHSLDSNQIAEYFTGSGINANGDKIK